MRAVVSSEQCIFIHLKKKMWSMQGKKSVQTDLYSCLNKVSIEEVQLKNPFAQARIHSIRPNGLLPQGLGDPAGPGDGLIDRNPRKRETGS